MAADPPNDARIVPAIGRQQLVELSAPVELRREFGGEVRQGSVDVLNRPLLAEFVT